MNDQAQKLRQMVKNKDGQDFSRENSFTEIITICSGKGGVGKSTLAINLAFALQEFNNQILLIDGNLGLYNLDILFGINTGSKFEKLLRGDIDWREAVTPVHSGIDLLCGGKNPITKISRSDNSNRKFREEFNFILDIQSTRNYDYIIIDTGAGVNKTMFTFAHLSDYCIVLTTSELASVTDTYALVKSLLYVEVDSQVNLVVNRCKKEREAIVTWKNLNKVLKHYINYEIRLLGYIFEDHHVVSSVKRQRPILLSTPNTSSGIAIKNLARKLVTVGVCHS